MSFRDKLFGYDVGIDLGDDCARVWVKGKGIVLDEPVDGARRMQMGAWKSDEQDAAVKLLKKCLSVVPKSLFGPRVFLAVTEDISEMGETKLLYAVRSAGVREVHLVENTMAAALGAGMTVTEPVGNMVVNIDGKTADAALIALAGVVYSDYVRRGERGSASKADDGFFTNSIIKCMHDFLEHCPPELAADLVEGGITLTGSEALRPGLDKRIAEATGLPVHIAEEPATATIRGLGKYIDIHDELLAFERKRREDERRRQEDQYKAELRRRERLTATSTLLMPDGRDFLTWSREIEYRIARLESICGKSDSIEEVKVSDTIQRPQSEAPYLKELAEWLSVPIPKNATPGDIASAIKQALSETTRYSGAVLSAEAFEECRAAIPTTKDTKIFEAYHALITKVAGKKIIVLNP